MGKKARTRQYQQKPDFLQKSGAGNLCPLGNCLNNSWSCSLQPGPAAVLASASGEPTGAGPAASHPPLLPNLPADVFFQSSPCTKADLCSDTWHRNQLLGAREVLGLGGVKSIYICSLAPNRRDVSTDFIAFRPGPEQADFQMHPGISFCQQQQFLGRMNPFASL